MRRKLYEFPFWSLEALLRGLAEAKGLFRLENWPTDAKVIAAHIDPARQRILLTVDSDSFPEIPEGAHLYTETPVFSYRKVITAEVIWP